jgi:hypothetical protein
MTYTVAKITTPDGVFFTARSDDRTPEEVVADGISGYATLGNRSPIYESLNRHKSCSVTNIFTGLAKSEAEAKMKTLVEYERALNPDRVLNVKV